MNYIDVYYQSDDGLPLYARDYPGPMADAPVILCLPGLTRNSKDFADLANDFQHTHRVICPDQRGRGRSVRDTDASRYQPRQYVGDMLALLDVLRIPNVVVIGTSLGGLMALLMMVVLVAPFISRLYSRIRSNTITVSYILKPITVKMAAIKC